MEKLGSKPDIDPKSQTRDRCANLLLGEFSSNMLDSRCHWIVSGRVTGLEDNIFFQFDKVIVAEASVIAGNTG